MPKVKKASKKHGKKHGVTTHLCYKRVRALVINGRKRALYKKVRRNGKKPKTHARYRKYKTINGVPLYLRVAKRRVKAVKAKFGCSAYGCGARFGQHGHYHSLGQTMAAYPPVVAATPAPAHASFGYYY